MNLQDSLYLRVPLTLLSWLEGAGQCASESLANIQEVLDLKNDVGIEIYDHLLIIDE
jgi:hypothetical protein